jgi:signal transduction histidine kinase
MQSLREKRAAEGHHLGLGLYIVALVAKHHHGEPWARSTETGAEVGFTVKA